MLTNDLQPWSCGSVVIAIPTVLLVLTLSLTLIVTLPLSGHARTLVALGSFLPSLRLIMRVHALLLSLGRRVCRHACDWVRRAHGLASALWPRTLRCCVVIVLMLHTALLGCAVPFSLSWLLAHGRLGRHAPMPLLYGFLLRYLMWVAFACVLLLVSRQRRRFWRGTVIPVIPAASPLFPAIAPMHSPAWSGIGLPAMKERGWPTIIAHGHAQNVERHRF